MIACCNPSKNIIVHWIDYQCSVWMEGDEGKGRREDEECKIIQSRENEGVKARAQTQTGPFSLIQWDPYNPTFLGNLINQNRNPSSLVCYLEMKSSFKHESVCMWACPLIASPSNHPPTSSLHDTAKSKMPQTIPFLPRLFLLSHCVLHCGSLQFIQTSLLCSAT